MTLKNPWPVCILGLLLSSSSGAAARSPAELDKLAADFSTTDGMSQGMAEQMFEKKVEATRRTEWLAALWTRAAALPARDNVRGNILHYCIAHSAWDARTLPFIDAAEHDANPMMRQVALYILLERKDPALRERILRFLDDPDDQLREWLVVAISRWPDSTTLLRDYVKRNAKKPERAGSVKHAQGIIDYRASHPAPQ